MTDYMMRNGDKGCVCGVSTGTAKNIGICALGDGKAEQIGIDLEVVDNHGTNDSIGGKILERSKLWNFMLKESMI